MKALITINNNKEITLLVYKNENIKYIPLALKEQLKTATLSEEFSWIVQSKLSLDAFCSDLGLVSTFASQGSVEVTGEDNVRKLIFQNDGGELTLDIALIN